MIWLIILNTIRILMQMYTGYMKLPKKIVVNCSKRTRNMLNLIVSDNGVTFFYSELLNNKKELVE